MRLQVISCLDLSEERELVIWSVPIVATQTVMEVVYDCFKEVKVGRYLHILYILVYVDCQARAEALD